MNIVSLRDNFVARYKIECLKRKVEEVNFTNQGKLVATLIYDAVGEIQSKTGIIESSQIISLVSGTNEYPLNLDFGMVKLVSCNNNILCKRTTEWINKQIDLGNTGTDPSDYAITVLSNTTMGSKFNILLFPTPSTVTNLTINYTSDRGAFDPTIDKDAYSTNYTILPSVYDRAIIFHMVDSMFGDSKPNFDKEMTRLIAKQFNGQKLNYKMTGVI